MGLQDVQVRTMSCNGPDCTKTVTFDVRLREQVVMQEGNEWLKASRVLQTADGRVLLYCSDECEVKSAALGIHNPPEQKKIIDNIASPAAIQAAAESAKAAEAATAALKAGQGIQIAR